MKSRILAGILILGLALGLSIVSFSPAPAVIRAVPSSLHPQFVGATQVPGFFTGGVNAVVNAAIGSAGAVTNPATGFVILVQGGPIYCGASEQMFAQSTLTLVANTTYQIEWNCGSETLYAKTAVTAPGTPTATPGIPATLLFPIAGVEVPLATVVCGTTSCGNGGNGSITDVRPVAAFPGSGTPLNTSTFANLPTTNVTDGTMLMCTSCTQPAAGATCTSGAANVLAVRLAGVWRCI